MKRHLLPLLCAALLSPSLAAEPLPLASATFTPSDGVGPFPVCYNYGCKEKELVTLSAAEWAEVEGWFQPPARNAAEERHQLRNAHGWLEVMVGNHTPIHRNLGQLPQTDQWPGQLDCIDESLNTTTYLSLFESHGLMRYHRVVERAYRRTLFDQHWAAQIEENGTGDRWVIDGWWYDFGQLPDVQPYDEWSDIPFFWASDRTRRTTSD